MKTTGPRFLYPSYFSCRFEVKVSFFMKIPGFVWLFLWKNLLNFQEKIFIFHRKPLLIKFKENRCIFFFSNGLIKLKEIYVNFFSEKHY
jgi:hypothetical protein